MGQPSWRRIAPAAGGHLMVPEAAGILWTRALDYLIPGKLIRITVISPVPSWRPEGLTCGPDGDPAAAKADLPVSGAARGALVGRIGGSTADLTSDNRMLLFSVGRVCVLKVPDEKHGGLFLGVNDKPELAINLQGSLEVAIDEAI
jgi:hypothetical protein